MICAVLEAKLKKVSDVGAMEMQPYGRYQYLAEQSG